MFGDHFYHATMRKSVAVFGTLFNNIKVVRKASDGSILNQIKVPLAYGPKQKFLARLDQETGFDAPMAIKLPRMAFDITELAIDTSQKLPKRTTFVNEIDTSNSNQKKTVKFFTSYDIGMNLYVMAKNQDDGLQIIEQILPYFQPDYTVTIKPIDGFDHKQDVPITLDSVQIEDQYEGEFTERRVLIYTLAFTMKMKFYGPTSKTGIIKEINIDFNEDKAGNNVLENLDIRIDQSEADSDDNYTVTTTVSGDSSSEGTGTTTYELTVATKTIGTGNAYFYNGVQQEGFNLSRGGIYVFNHPTDHPLRFSETSDGTHNSGTEYTTGVTTASGATTISVTYDTPSTLYYYCSSHSGMGGRINIV